MVRRYDNFKGHHHTEKSKKQISDKLKGRRIDHLTKIGFKKGYIPWNKDKKGIPDDTREKMSEASIGRKHTEKSKKLMSLNQLGSKNSHYKNGMGGYRKLAWSNLPHKCNRCPIDNYKILIVHHKDKNRGNNKLNNLEILCLNCHTLEHNFNNAKNLGIYAMKGYSKPKNWKIER